MTETPFIEPVPWQPSALPSGPAAAEPLGEWLASEEYNLNGMGRDFRDADLSGGDLLGGAEFEAWISARGGQVQVIPPRRPAGGTP